MLHRSLHPFILGAVLATAGACRAVESPTPRVGGTFPLAALNEVAVPMRYFEIPGRPGPTGCFAVATGGWLTLDAAGGTFSMGLRLQDSCAGPGGGTSFGSDTIATGRYVQRGEQLDFAADIGAGRTEPFAGRVAPGAIEVDDRGRRYRYSR